MIPRAAHVLLALVFGVVLVSPASPDDGLDYRKIERLHLDDVVAGVEGERTVELQVRALTRDGDPIDGLRSAHLQVSEDGRIVDRDDVVLESLIASNRGMSCVLALDVSRTMKGEPFQRARAAALAFLDRLGVYDQAAVVAFGSRVDVISTFQERPGAARSALENLEVDRESLSTVLYDGLGRAIELIRRDPALPRRSIVVLFSDGKDSGSQSTLESAIQRAQGAQSEPSIVIFSIGYARFGGRGLESLARLSQETSGDFLDASSAASLDSFYDYIWNQVSKSYVVRFPARMDGAVHTIEITADGRTDSRAISYPTIRGPVPLLIAVGALAVGALGLLLVLLLRRNPGRLIVEGGPLAGQRFPLRRGVIRIGALDDNDIVLTTPAVSRHHAELNVRGRRVDIQDLQSRNRTFVNGTPVDAAEVNPGDRLAIADVELRYER